MFEHVGMFENQGGRQALVARRSSIAGHSITPQHHKPRRTSNQQAPDAAQLLSPLVGMLLPPRSNRKTSLQCKSGLWHCSRLKAMRGALPMTSIVVISGRTDIAGTISPGLYSPGARWLRSVRA